MLAVSGGARNQGGSGDTRAHSSLLPLVRAGVSHQALSPRGTDNDPRQAEEHEQGRDTPERVRSGGVRGAAQGASLPWPLKAPGGGPRAPSPALVPWPLRPGRTRRRISGRATWAEAAAGPERRGTAGGDLRVPGPALVHLHGGPGTGRRGEDRKAPAAAASCARAASRGRAPREAAGAAVMPTRVYSGAATGGAPRAGRERLLPLAEPPSPWPSRSERLRSPTSAPAPPGSAPRCGAPCPTCIGGCAFLPAPPHPTCSCWGLGERCHSTWATQGWSPRFLDHVGVDPCAAFSLGAARGRAWTRLGVRAGEEASSYGGAAELGDMQCCFSNPVFPGGKKACFSLSGPVTTILWVLIFFSISPRLLRIISK